MPSTALRLFAACTAAALAAGCVAVPGDPYYESGPYYPPTSSVTVYEQPGYVYSSPRVYPVPVPYPVYTPPPPPRPYGWQRDRDHWQNREGWRRDADRREADRREGERRREADRQRDQAERDRRDQAERDRRAQQDRGRGNTPAAPPAMIRTPRPEWR